MSSSLLLSQSSALYKTPTPLEQAHAAFLLERYFGNVFPIPGKLAVPFLTTSGVERTILRDIWNIVDPDMHGKLFEKHQWWTVLKLVALAQQQQGGVSVEAHHLLVHLLHSTLIPLPVFAEVQVPSPDVLMQQYYKVSTTVGNNDSDALSDPLSVAFEALGPVKDAPLPSLLSTTVSKQNDECAPSSSPLEDEFGSFHSPDDSSSNVPWTAAGLDSSLTGPSLLLVSSQERPALLGAAHALDTELHQDDDDDEFGQFAKHVEPNIRDDPQSATAHHSRFAPVQDAPLPVHGVHSNDGMQQPPDKNDEFGNFSIATKEPETSSLDRLSAAFDSLAPIQDAPLPPLGVVAAHHAIDTLLSQDVNDDLTNLPDAAPKEPPDSSSSSSSSSTTALDSCAPIPQVTTPLPVLLGVAVHPEDTVQQQKEEDDNDDDDFGEFANAPTETKASSTTADSLSVALDTYAPVQKMPLLPVLRAALVDVTTVQQQQQQDDTNDLSNFAEAPNVHETFSSVTDPLSAALDSLAPVQNAPLPPLIRPALDSLVSNAPKELEYSSGAPADPLSAALDSLGPIIPDAPLPCQDNDDDDFGDFTNAPTEMSKEEHETSRALDLVKEDAPLPSLGGAHSNDQQNDADDHHFGEEFAGMPKDRLVDSVVAPNPLTAALSALAPVLDAPLPVLGAYTDSVPAEEQGDHDDDFGDFAHAPKETSMAEQGAASADPLSVALDSLAPVRDAPLPPLLGVHSDLTVQQQDDNGSFGDFADAPKEASELQHEASDPVLSSALDAATLVPNAPLPSLKSYVNATTIQGPQDDDDDDFRGFLNAPKEALGAKGPLTSASDPLSAAMDALAPIHDAPLPILGAYTDTFQQQQQQQDDDNGFGDFKDAPIETAKAGLETTSDPLSSALDALARVHDAPLPFLGAYTDTTHQLPQDDDDDDFGDFEDAPKLTEEVKSEAVDRLSSALHALAPAQDAPLPSLGAYEQPQQDNDDEGFGDFTDASKAAVAAEPEETSDLPSSALDALAPMQEAPLPSLGADTDDTAHQQSQRDDDCDDFGDFEDASKDAHPADTLDAFVDAPLPTMGTRVDSLPREDDDVEFGGIEYAPKETSKGEPEAASDPLSSALDALASVQDAPLPSLGAYYTDATHQPPQDDDDDFGDFEDAPIDATATEVREEAGGTCEPVSVDVANDFSSFADGTSTLVPPKPAAAVVGSDNDDPLLSALNALAPSQDATLQSLNSAVVSNDNKLHEQALGDDSVGDFEDASKEPTAVEVIQPTESKEGIDHLSSAFDDLTPVKNAPLQPLGAFDTLSSLEDAPLPPLVTQDMSTENGATDNDDDDFGEFEDALQDAAPPEAETKNLGNGVHSNGEKSSRKAATDLNDGFGEINDAPSEVGHIIDAADIEVTAPSSDDDDGFGDFEDALESTMDEAAPHRNWNGGDNGESIEDAKGAVHEEVNNNVVISRQAEASVVPAAGTTEDPFSFNTTSSFDLGGFETTSEQVIHIEDQMNEVDMLSNNAVPEVVVPLGVTADDSFGDFAGFDKVDEEKAGDSAFSQETVVNLGVTASEQGNDKDQTNEASREMGEFGDFDSFQDATAKKEETLEDMRNAIKEMQMKLRILSSTGSQMDFLKSFETHIMPKNKPSGWRLSFHHDVQKDKPKADAEQLQRGRRCCQVMTLLTSSHTKLISHWKKIINVVRDELAMGSMLLEEALSLSGEQAVLVALATLVAGLAEYVRVVRSIVATLGDLLGEEVKVDPTRWSKDMVLLQSALQVEELWTSVQRAAKGFKLVVPPLENVAEIRTKGLVHVVGDSTNLCQLTLQPLASTKHGTTQSPVEWQGKVFMACAANLWSNRVSTTVPE